MEIKSLSIQNSREAVEYIKDSPKRLLSVSFLTIVYFFVFLFVSAPQFSISLLSNGYIVYSIQESVWLLQSQSGTVGLALTILYSVGMGVLTVLSVSQMRAYSVSNGIRGILSLVPGIVVAGCAGCGIGLLSLVGITGLATVFPFSGNLVRVLGIILIFVLITSLGNPEKI